MRLVRRYRGLECHLASRPGAQQGSQALQQRRPVQAKRKALVSGFANNPRRDIGRRNRKLAIVDVGRHAFRGRGRAALERDLKPDEVGRSMVDRDVAAGRTKGQPNLLQPDEVDARLEVVGVFQIDADRAEQRRGELPQLFGIGSPKDRKMVQQVGGGMGHGCSVVSSPRRLSVPSSMQPVTLRVQRFGDQ